MPIAIESDSKFMEQKAEVISPAPAIEASDRVDLAAAEALLLFLDEEPRLPDNDLRDCRHLSAWLPQPWGETMATPEPNPTVPKAFISYSWEGDAHRVWVTQLATRLRQKDGVDVTLDHWHSEPGDQIPAFMARAVRDSEFVIVVCTPRFKERLDVGSGGVGWEGRIMMAYDYMGGGGKRFIPVLRRGSWNEAAPDWLLGTAYIDLSTDPYSESGYEELVRTLYGEREKAPPIGPHPHFRVSKGSPASPPPAPVTPPEAPSWPQHQTSVTPYLTHQPATRMPEPGPTIEIPLAASQSYAEVARNAPKLATPIPGLGPTIKATMGSGKTIADQEAAQTIHEQIAKDAQAFQEAAQTIYEQIAKDAQKQNAERQKIMQDLSKYLLEIRPDITLNKTKGAFKSAESNDAFIRA